MYLSGMRHAHSPRHPGLDSGPGRSRQRRPAAQSAPAAALVDSRAAQGAVPIIRPVFTVPSFKLTTRCCPTYGAANFF